MESLTTQGEFKMNHQGFGRPLAWLLITVYAVTIGGCSTTNLVTLPVNEPPVGSNFTIATVTLKDGEIIEFDGDGGWYLEKTKEGKSYRVIVGTTQNKNVEIDPEKIREVTFEQEEPNVRASFGLGFLIGLPVGAGLILLIAVSAQ